MNKFNSVFGLFAVLFTAFSNANIIDIDYQYDGSTLTLINGPSLFGTELMVGDTLNLTYTAEGHNSYWDFSSVGIEGNVNLGFQDSFSCGARSSSGSYNANLNGSNVLNNTYSAPYQSCVHLGPDSIDFSGLTMIDVFSISYTLESSAADNNVIGPYSEVTWWQVWELFDGEDVVFNYEPDGQIPEPTSIALFALAIMALLTRRYKAL